MKDFIDNSLDEIQYETIKAIPKRQEIINSIFELYRVKNYIPIIPLVLSQADGIMKEFVKSGLYTSELSKLKFQNSDFYVNFLSNYEQLLNIENRNDYELFMKDISDMTKFNRHSILHGESFEFGNELNAIKAILLFTFIVEVHGANSEN